MILRPLSYQEAQVERIKELRRILDELRTQQRTGSSSVRTERVFSDDEYDIEVPDVGFRNRVVEMSFVPTDDTAGDRNAPYRMSWTKAQSDDAVIGVIMQRLEPEADRQRWLIYLNGNDSFPTAWYRLKFYVFANGGGTISAKLL